MACSWVAALRDSSRKEQSPDEHEARSVHMALVQGQPLPIYVRIVVLSIFLERRTQASITVSVCLPQRHSTRSLPFVK